MRDFKRLQEDPPAGVSGAPSENNIMVWNAVIFGPEGTPFEDGTFKLTIEFTEEYPNKPPTVRFVSKMFHPNVYADGSICLDILQNRWSPTYDVSSILTSIQSLLDEPNPNSPANSQAAQLYQENKREYEKRVSAIVEQSWPEVVRSVRAGVVADDVLNVPLAEQVSRFNHFHAQTLPGELLLDFDWLGDAVAVPAEAAAFPAHLTQQLVSDVILLDLLLQRILARASENLRAGNGAVVSLLPQVGLDDRLSLS
ncbi:hypothetical protein CCH79_00005712 [Gambusia affinis]|uniref:E2 ubiquitin-conjugating enzyme n=1 Tax=Gambusia affinis TaxID=33528 RepID=A0A315V966_GAMAF|nr:hypothetical protein CCH79_00005712 [Gambusia affinis]